MVFPVVIYECELDHKESWALKNWYFLTLVLEKTPESPLNCEEIEPVNLKSVLNVHWKDWCWSWSSNALATWWEELTLWISLWCWDRMKAGGKGDDRELNGWMHHQLDRHEFEQAMDVSDGQGSLAYCSPWSFRVRHEWATELNWWISFE